MDEIRIENLKIYAHHGVFDFEKENGQNFYLNAVFGVELQEAGMTDDLDKTVNYALLCEEMENHMKAHSFDLIEAAAEHLICELFMKYPKILTIGLEIRKPEAPVDAVFDSLSVVLFRKRHRSYIAFGSNAGDSQKHIESAIREINKSPYCCVKKVSDIIKTTPYGGVEQSDFYNGVMEVETILEPKCFLHFLQQTEIKEGRVRTVHWGPRTLDLDILFFDDLIYSDEELTVPHPDMKNRDFVLVPMQQVAPHFCHPICHKTMTQMADEVKEHHII